MTSRSDICGDHNDKETSLNAVDKNAEYYFTDIIFQVENQLFKVPRRNFAIESEIFADMFRLPIPTDGDEAQPDGSSDGQPLRLEGIKKSDFIQLLRVMFPSDSQDCDMLGLEEWTSVLKLSTMWRFNKIRMTALKKMEDSFSLSPVDKILIARKFDVSVWLVPALNALVQREKAIDFGEGRRLGIDWVLKLAELRERDLKANGSTRTCQSCKYTGPLRCNSCNSTTFNRCASCSATQPQPSATASQPGMRSNTDYSKEIRELFGVL